MKRYISQFIITAFKIENSFDDNMKSHNELKRLLNLFFIRYKEIHVIQEDRLLVSLAIEPKDYQKVIDSLYQNLHEVRQLENEVL